MSVNIVRHRRAADTRRAIDRSFQQVGPSSWNMSWKHCDNRHSVAILVWPCGQSRPSPENWPRARVRTRALWEGYRSHLALDFLKNQNTVTAASGESFWNAGWGSTESRQHSFWSIPLIKEQFLETSDVFIRLSTSWQGFSWLLLFSNLKKTLQGYSFVVVVVNVFLKSKETKKNVLIWLNSKFRDPLIL